MPSTTETITVDRPAHEVFDYLADFANLEEWDPTFTSSRRVDDSGAVGEGSRYHAVASLAGASLELDLEIVEHSPPHRVVLRGAGDGMRTREDIRVEPIATDRCEVTYVSEFETDRPDLLETVMQPGFTLLGKAVMRRMRHQLER